MYSDTSKLLAWKKSHELVLKIYEVTKDFPKDEQFGLIIIVQDQHFGLSMT